MLETILLLIVFVLGYVAAVFTWSRIRMFAVGALDEAASLRARARKIEDAFRGK